MSEEVEFPAGLFAKAPHDKAPDFVKAALSIKRAELGNWLRGQSGEWINLQIKESRNGKWYVAVDNWEPQQQGQGQGQQVAAPAQQQSEPTAPYTEQQMDDFDSDVIPF